MLAAVASPLAAAEERAAAGAAKLREAAAALNLLRARQGRRAALAAAHGEARGWADGCWAVAESAGRRAAVAARRSVGLLRAAALLRDEAGAGAGPAAMPA
jgi:hypothetical protein